MKHPDAIASGRRAAARRAIRIAVVTMALALATGCANRLDRRVYLATTTDACAALGSANTPTTPPPMEVYRISVIGRKHGIDVNTQLAAGWVPAAAVDVLLNPERPDDAPPAVINPATQPATTGPARAEPVLLLDPRGVAQHVATGSRLVLLFGPDAQATLDEWTAAAANGRFVDPKVQADVERIRLRTDRCWLDAIHASLIGDSAAPAPAPANATAAVNPSEGLK